MAQLIMAEGAAPSTPSTGKAALYVDTTPLLQLIRDDGISLPGGIVTGGTFSPTIIGSSTPGSHTYSQQEGAWVRIASVVLVQFRVAITTKDGAMAGNALIGGFPITIANVNPPPAGVIGSWAGLATSVVHLSIRGIINSVTANIFHATAAAAGVSTTQASDIASGTSISGSIMYRL